MPTLANLVLAVFVAREVFETVIDTTGTEFKAQGNNNGLPRESLIKRTFVMTEDTALQIDGITVDLPRGKSLRDVGQALKVVKQKPESILVRDRVRFDAGQELPAALGQTLYEGGYPVREVQPEPAPELEPELTEAEKKKAEADAKAAEKKAQKDAQAKAEADAKAADKGAQA